jgi:hypothetical protein
MALTQTINHHDGQVQQAQSQSSGHARVQRNNVIPFPATRVLLQVTLPHSSGDDPAGTSSLRTLLHSPLGVYVAGTQVIRNEVRVQFDIAIEDLDFTLHTLIATLPVALIGPLQRHGLADTSR